MERAVLSVQLRRQKHAAFAAGRAQLLATLLGAPLPRARAFGEAVRKIARNALGHAAGGKFRLLLSTSAGLHRIEAVVADSGPGPDRAGTALPGTVSADEERAARIAKARQAVDELTINDGPGGETVVRIALVLPGPPAVEKETFTHWANPLARIRDSAALGAALRQIGVLCGEHAAAAEYQRELEAELETLRASHETLSLLAVVASKTDSAVIVMDHHARVDWVNAGFVRLTGYAPAEVAGFHPFDFLHGPQTDAETAGEIAAAFEAAEGHSQELLHYRKDGGTYWASLSITPVFDEDGELSRWICIFSDITKRREAQTALERAREAAEAASHAKSEFLANMSHEIRTPMNAVIGMTELALLTDLTPEQREYLGIAKESAESLLRLLNEILDLSKIEAGKIEIDRVEFNLPELIEDTMKALSVRAKQKGLRLIWQPPQEVKEHLLGDPVRLRQILVNLVDNAIKFTDEGQVAVCVEPQWQADDEVGLHFSVSDTGVGIPAGEMDRIFEGFTQGDSSTTRRFGGTGLGLTISSHLVQLMQGQMWVESKESRGSTFHFSLGLGIPPRQGPAEQRCEPRRPIHVPDLADGLPPRNLHILVADDNAANRILAERILQKRGHVTTAAINGQQVLQALSKRHYDAVLMDVQMPGMDGFATTNAIREMEQYADRHIPVIAMTAYAMKGDHERCLAAGMDGYLAKPLRARELIALVESMAHLEVECSSAPLPASAAGPAVDFAPEGGLSAFRQCNVPQDERPDVAARQAGLPLSPAVEAATTPDRPGQIQYDFGSALARVEGDREILSEQMEFFLRDCPAILADIGAAISSRDGDSLRRAAHRLKGLAAGFDAAGVVDYARQLEEAGLSNDFRKTPALCDDLQAEAARLQQNIQAYLQAGAEA